MPHVWDSPPSSTKTLIKSNDRQKLALPAFANSQVCDQALGHLGKRGLDGLLILNQGVFLLGLCQSDARFQPPRREDRLGHLRHKAPRAVRTVEQTCQL